MSLRVSKVAILEIISSARGELKNQFEARIKDLLQHLYLVEKLGNPGENNDILYDLSSLKSGLQTQNVDFQKTEELITELSRKIMKCFYVNDFSEKKNFNALFSTTALEKVKNEGIPELNGLTMITKTTFWKYFRKTFRIDRDCKKLFNYIYQKVADSDIDKEFIYFNTLLEIFSHLYGKSSKCKKIYRLHKIINLKLPVTTRTVKIRFFDFINKITLKERNQMTVNNFFLTIGTDELHDFHLRDCFSEKVSFMLIFKKNKIIPVSLKGKKQDFVIQENSKSFRLHVGDRFEFKDRNVRNRFQVKSITYDTRSGLDLKTNSVISMNHSITGDFFFDSSRNNNFVIGRKPGSFGFYVNGKSIGGQHAVVNFSNGKWYLQCNSTNGIKFQMQSIKDFDPRTSCSFLGNSKDFTVSAKNFHLKIKVSE